MASNAETLAGHALLFHYYTRWYLFTWSTSWCSSGRAFLLQSRARFVRLATQFDLVSAVPFADPHNLNSPPLDGVACYPRKFCHTKLMPSPHASRDRTVPSLQSLFTSSWMWPGTDPVTGHLGPGSLRRCWTVEDWGHVVSCQSNVLSVKVSYAVFFLSFIYINSLSTEWLLPHNVS